MSDDPTRKHVTATASATGPGIAPLPGFGPFGAYELLDAFSGGMAIVYRARHRVLDRTVALKVLNPGRPLFDTDRARFETEAKAVEQLKHPHIIKVHEYGEQDGKPYFTMDFIEGGNLSKKVGEFAGQPRRAVALIEKIARAVQHAHANRILHRDLKPANILMRGPDDPVVADFGLAKMLDSDVQHTQTGAVLGTPPYMAPEQFLSRHDLIGPSTDVWALGIMLHELLTGRRPFAGHSHKEVASTVLTMEPRPPSKLDASVPTALDAVVLRCLSREPGDRYASAGELADDLVRWLNGRRPLKRPLTRAAKRRLTIGAGVFVALLVAMFAGALIWWNTLDPEAKARQQLAVNHRIELSDAKGPRWPRTVAGEVEIQPNGDGAFTVTDRGKAPGLVELMTSTGQDGYRFRALVQHAGGKGAVGVYLGRRAFAIANSEVTCFLSVSFNPPADGVGIVNFDVNCGQRVRHLATAEFRADGWTELAVRVSPDGFAVAVDGRPVIAFVGPERIAEVPRSDIAARAREFAQVDPTLKSVVPTYDPRDGIGIAVWGASARVKDVTVELTR